MNLNPNAKQILIYGDSLVYGKKPGSPERFTSDLRFTGIIQKELGEDFNIVEAGLRARNLVGENPFFAERDGLKQFGAIFSSHVPLDLVVIMLGTNDCNRSPERSTSDVAAALDAYREKIVTNCKILGLSQVPKLLVVAPPYIKGIELAKSEAMAKIFGPDSEERSRKIENALEEYCSKNGISFFKSSTACDAKEAEGIHLDEENNRSLGVALAKIISANIE